MESEESKDVHTEHCCQRHGCKYGDVNCTVMKASRGQSHMCEWCSDELQGGELDNAYLLNEMYDRGYNKAWDEANEYIRTTWEGGE